jgi:hypothetical protein
MISEYMSRLSLFLSILKLVDRLQSAFACKPDRSTGPPTVHLLCDSTVGLSIRQRKLEAQKGNTR